MYQYIKVTKYTVFFLAIMVGIFYVAPQALIWLNLHQEGRPYIVMQIGHHLDELIQYMPRAREIYDGHFPPSDLTFNVSYPTVFPAIPSLLFSIFIAIFMGNIDMAYLAVTMIFSGSLFLIFYLLAHAFVQNKILSIFAGLLASFTVLLQSTPRALFSGVGFFNGVIKKFYPFISTPLDRYPLSRFDDPLLTAPIYLLTILFLWLFWRDGKKLYAVAAGIFGGLLFYTYLHYWAYLAVVVGLLFLYVLYDFRRNPERLKGFLLLLVIVGFLAIPFVVNYFNFNRVPEIEDYVGRIGLERTRSLELGQTIGKEIFLHYALYAFLAFLIYKLWFKKDRSRAVFFLAFIVANFFVWNIQVITGFVPHPDHWGKPIGAVLFFIILTIIYELAKKYISSKAITVILSIASVLLVSKAFINTIIFINPPADIKNAYTFDPDIVDSWKWINTNLGKEPKIISPSLDTSYYLYSYTGARPYLPTAENTMMPNRLLESRYLIAHKLFQVSEELMITGLHNGDNYRKAFLYYVYYKKQGSDLNEIPNAKIQELKGQYKNLHPAWQLIDADYAYYGPEEKKISAGNFIKNENLELIYQNASVKILKIKK